MRHVTISSYGTYVGVSGERLVVTDKEGSSWETPLSRIRFIRVAKPGISLSSNLISACAARGIRIFFPDWRGQSQAVLTGTSQQKAARFRKAQFDFIDSPGAIPLSTEIISCKIRNQRAVLLYFLKYLSHSAPDKAPLLREAASSLAVGVTQLSAERLLKIRARSNLASEIKWQDTLLGQEGINAQIYWQALARSGLMPPTFKGRQGRGATEITNISLNYGYAILTSYVWTALENVGFELCAGVLHADNPGRASLVLDFMEEYRAWVVDRNIIKLRSQLERETELTQTLKKKIVDSVDGTMESKIPWRGKSIRLENVMQRQAYRLAGVMVDGIVYKGLHFRW